jgi:hypothetical protein
MNAHTKLTMHLSRHAYKRGRNTGEAPADTSRRSKSHFRVVRGNGGQMIVRFHGADIITAYEDGRIVLNTNGWYASPTTKGAMNDALSGFFGQGRIGTVHKWGLSQTAIRMNNKVYAYYDGMEFSEQGVLLSTPLFFEKRVTDTDETQEFRAELKESGFRDIFPVLYATATPPESGTYVRRLRDTLCDIDEAHKWPGIVAELKYQSYYERNSGRAHYDDHKKALAALIGRVTKNMKVTIKSDVTVL